MPGVSQDDEILDEDEHHDETASYKDFPTDEVSSSLVNRNRFAGFHLCIFCLFNKLRSQTMKHKHIRPFAKILAPTESPAHS